MLNSKTYRQHRLLFTYLFVLLFAFHFVNNVFCVHSHFINGKMVTHSHLFWTNPDGHQHSESQLSLIQQTNYALMTNEHILFQSPIFVYQILLRCLALAKEPSIVFLTDANGLGLRAPPSIG